MKIFKVILFFSLFFVILTFGSADAADHYRMIKHTGKIGALIGTNATYNMTFSLYDAPSGGTLLWQENAFVSVLNGEFTHLLGSVNPLPLLDYSKQYWVLSRVTGTRTGSTLNLSSMDALPAGAYCFYAEQSLGVSGPVDADTLDGQDSAYFCANSDLSSTQATLNNHMNDTGNPHSVTYTQAGAAAAVHDHNTDYVNVTGDTMSGSLTMDTGGGANLTLTEEGIQRGGDVTVDALYNAASSTVAVLNSDGTQVANLSVEGGISASSFTGDGSNLTNVDAETFDGMDSTAFAQSAHNHSGGNISSGTVSEAYIDGSIARDSEVTNAINTHTAIAGAHHSRYTNAEAVAAILNADGSGSTLDADLLDGQNSAAFASSGHNHNADYVNVTGDSMSGTLTVNTGGTYGIYSAGGTAGIYGSGSNYGVYGYGITYGVYGYGNNYGLYGASNNNAGVYGYGISYGVEGTGGTTGVYGTSENGYGVYGKHGGTNNYGYLGDANYGVYGYGSNYGVYGWGSNTGVSGGSNHIGVSGGGSDIGVSGVSNNTGVFGYGDIYAIQGIGGAYGLYAYGTNTGVFGWGDSYGGYFVGNVIVQGNFTATGTKSFAQPHPEDPSKELMYVAIEAPESAILLRGTARLVEGRATIETPDYFRLVAGSEGITVQFTPRSLDSKGLAAYKVSKETIEVGELMAGTGTYEFDYLITAKRSGFERHEPIQPNTHFTADGMKKEEFEQRYTKTDDMSVAAAKSLLISNGILTAEGKLNMTTVEKLGWKLNESDVAMTDK
jgi:hypothetical protein